MIWIVVVLALLVFVFILGIVSTKKQKSEAPRKLAQAKEAFDREEYIESLWFLSDAFYVPVSNKYQPGDAGTALEVVSLVEQILQKFGLEQGLLTVDLLPALTTAAKNGGEVPEHLTRPLQKFLEKVSGGSLASLKALVKEIQAGGVFVAESKAEDDDYSSQIQDGPGVALINEAGKLFMKGKLDAVIEFTGKHLAGAEPPLKAVLLEQRAGAYFAKKEYQAALDDYLAILKMFPRNKQVQESIAETYQKLGRPDKVREYLVRQ